MMLDPVLMPLTRAVVSPVAATVAIVSALLAHVPPGIDADSAIDDPTHTASFPVIVPASGSGFTVTIVLVNTVPHELLIV